MADIRKKRHETFELRGEKELRRALKEKEPTFAEVEQYLAEFRTACQNTIFEYLHALEKRGSDKGEQGEGAISSPSASEIESRLWDVHLKINARFRKILSSIRDDETRGNKRPVEKRKLLKRYSRFVSSSQRFYDGYIYHLLGEYNTGENQMPELNEIARQKNFACDASSSSPARTVNETLHRNIFESCHSSLIKLGDLSRYYQTELVDEKKREWKRAMENYSLASFVNPSSGMSHNQIAVIALADGDHLQVVYNLYRALQAKEPHPTAKGNLDIEFKKILSYHKKGEPLSRNENQSLISSFCYLHAQCYKGIEFPEHDELENEILRQLTVDLKENSLTPSLLQTICLINIAAEAHSRNQAVEQQDASGTNSQLCFQRLNVKVLFTLLQVLLAELEYSTEKSKVTSVAHCVLPVLRQYSSWLLANSESLASVTDTRDTPLFVQIREFWKSYANTLTLLTSSFDVPGLPELDYLLPEDVDTIGFCPLSNDATARRYLNNDGKLKSRFPASDRHTDSEMLFRIRELVVDGLDLVVHERIPVVMVDDEDNEAKLFVYKEEGLPQLSSPRPHGHTLSSTSIDHSEIQRQRPAPITNPNLLEDGVSVSASVSVAAAMNRMVDNLVESEPAESVPGVDDNTSWDNTYVMRNTRNQPPHGNGLGIPQSYSPGPQLPSILNTPFAPQPGDAMSPRSRPSTAVPGEPSNLTPTDNDGRLDQQFSPSQSPFYNQSIYQQGRYTQSSLEDPTSSFSPMHTPRLGGTYNGYIGQPPLAAQRSQYMRSATSHPMPMPFSSMPSQFSSTPQSSGVSSTRRVGIIGRQTPPNGQGG